MAKKSTSGYMGAAQTNQQSQLRGGVANQAVKGRPGVPSGIMSVDQYSAGKMAPQQVGWINGKWVQPAIANTGKVDPTAVNPCKVKPSGSTITR